MQIEFNFMQIFQFAFYLILGVAVWKIKNNKIRMLLIALAAIIFFANPARFKQEGMSKIERRVSIINQELPEKITSNAQSFEEKQAYEMAKLKSESKEILDHEKN